MSGSPSHNSHASLEELWLSAPEGQLSIDVCETSGTILIRSAIAGVKAEDLDITVSPDTVTIRGSRASARKQTRGEIVHMEECHWGAFSRSVVLPHAVNTQNVKAALQDGILTLTLKKTDVPKQVKVKSLDL